MKNRIRINEDLVLGGLFFMFGLALLLWIFPAQITVRGTEVVTSDTLPNICAYAIIAISLLFFLDASRAWRRGKPPAAREAQAAAAQPEEQPRGRLRLPMLVWVVLLCAAYVAALYYLGFILSSIAFMLFCFYQSGMRKWGKMILVACLSTAVFYVVFRTLMRVMLPQGELLRLLF